MTPVVASAEAERICQLAPVIPVLVVDDVAQARPLAEALIAGGLPALEVTLRTEAALDVIAAMAEVIGEEDLEEFERKYVVKIGIRRSLKELPGSYDCVFFDGETRQCKVYQARPRQCRTWPFWDSNLRTPQDWERTCKDCPGAGKGDLYQLEEIESRRGVFRV